MRIRLHTAIFLFLLLNCAPSRAQQWFEPSCGRYFGPAVKELGLVPGVLSTADRITRTGRISAADRPRLSPDGLVHEGPEAYSGRPVSAPAAVPVKISFKDNPDGRPVDSDLPFVLYLLDNGMLKDAGAMLTLYSPSDTLDYLRGWTAYNSRRLDVAAAAFAKVGEGSAFYDRSVFYGAMSAAHTGNYADALARLNAYNGPLYDLKASQIEGLEKIISVEVREKSPVLAAGLSTLVPGLGKIYAGRLGEGISAFLINGVFAALTADQWVHNGPRDWKTITLGSVGAIFYLGNIYGSYHSVSIYENEDRTYKQASQLYDLHTSVRDRLR